MDDFLKISNQLSAWIDEYLKSSERYPVLSRVKPGEIRKSLPQSPPEKPQAFEDIWKDFERIILPGITHWNHPSFFAYFAITGSGPGILADMLSSALNVNGMLWKTSPAATELEEVMMKWLGQMLGLPSDWFGIIMDTASVGSLCAMAAARESLGLGIRERGTAGRKDLPPLRVYTSAQAHSSIEKGAIVLGFGQEGVRSIAVDSDFQMKPEELERGIEEDLRNGWKPACVVATIGTTSTASIDPVPEITEICAHHKIWLHVDAAYAGSAAVLPGMKWIMKGCERADSLLMNPHKWLFVPFDCTAFYTKHPEILARAFSLVPDYLHTGEEGIHNLMDYGIQLGRRFRALKLWFVIRMYGVEGLQAILRRHLELAQMFASWMRESSNFEVVAPVHFSLVCFRAIPSGSLEEQNRFNEKLMNEANQTGEMYLSHTKLNGKIVLRLAIGNMQTELAHVQKARDILQSHFRRIQSM